MEEGEERSLDEREGEREGAFLPRCLLARGESLRGGGLRLTGEGLIDRLLAGEGLADSEPLIPEEDEDR